MTLLQNGNCEHHVLVKMYKEPCVAENQEAHATDGPGIHYKKHWYKHILLVNTKGSGVAKLRRKPSPTCTHTFTSLNTYTKK